MSPAAATDSVRLCILIVDGSMSGRSASFTASPDVQYSSGERQHDTKPIDTSEKRKARRRDEDQRPGVSWHSH